VNDPIVGPGNMEICRRCTTQHERDVERMIADEVQAHPEMINGNSYLRDLVKMRRQNLQSDLGSVEELAAIVNGRGA
jgi:hypothetical protein